MSCNNCFWCRYSLTPPKIWKCKLYPKKRFNKPILHGWFCKDKIKYEVVEQKIKEKENEIDN